MHSLLEALKSAIVICKEVVLSLAVENVMKSGQSFVERLLCPLFGGPLSEVPLAFLLLSPRYFMYFLKTGCASSNSTWVWPVLEL